MARTISDFIGGDPNQKKQPAHKTFFLDDVLERNPTQYCPSCDSTAVTQLRTHNAEGADYQCTSCKGTYEIVYCTRSEDAGH